MMAGTRHGGSAAHSARFLCEQINAHTGAGARSTEPQSVMNASATQLLDEYTDFQLRRDSFQTRPEKEYDWDNSIVPITQEDMVVRKRGGLKQAYCVFCYHGVQMLRPDVRVRLVLCGCVAVWLYASVRSRRPCCGLTPIPPQNTTLLNKFISDRGKIVPRRTSNCCAKHQRKYADLICASSCEQPCAHILCALTQPDCATLSSVPASCNSSRTTSGCTRSCVRHSSCPTRYVAPPVPCVFRCKQLIGSCARFQETHKPVTFTTPRDALRAAQKYEKWMWFNYSKVGAPPPEVDWFPEDE